MMQNSLGNQSETFTIQIDHIKRDYPVIQLDNGSRVPFVNLSTDIELISVAANKLLFQLPKETHYLICTNVRSITLTYEIAKNAQLPFIIVRRLKKSYMHNPLGANVQTSLGSNQKMVWLDGRDVTRLTQKNVVLVGDVYSSGSTMGGVQALMQKIDCQVLAQMTVFSQGEGNENNELIKLAELPNLE